MKNALTKVSTAVILSQLWVMRAFALTGPGDINGLENNISNSDDLKKTIIKYLVIVLDFVTLLGVIFVIIAGLRLIVSGGDEGEKDKAKKTIIYVIIGILVVIFARVIVTFFANINNA